MKNVEEFLFVNQMVTKQEASLLDEGDSQDLIQFSHQTLLDQMDQKHQKLYELCKKKIGIEKSVFNKVIESGDICEWSIEACLNAAQKHDNMVIQEALSVDEQTMMAQSHLYVDYPLGKSMINKSINLNTSGL